jgi:hypothetical protein
MRGALPPCYRLRGSPRRRCQRMNWSHVCGCQRPRWRCARAAAGPGRHQRREQLRLDGFVCRMRQRPPDRSPGNPTHERSIKRPGCDCRAAVDAQPRLPPPPPLLASQRCIGLCCNSTDIWLRLSCIVSLTRALQARNGNTALDIARSHGRRGVAALLEHHAGWEIAACAAACAALHMCSLPLSTRVPSSMLSVAVSRTAAAGGLHTTQRFRLLLSGGSNRLLIYGLAQ